MDSSTLTG
jgi:hypothetical protein